MVAPRALGEHRLVGIDTNVFVYAFEDYPEFGSQCRAVLRSVHDGELGAVMSALVLGELLVRPFSEKRPEIARGYADLLGQFPHLEQVPADAAICELAAQLRADSRSLRLPDAVHIATALSKGATALISNDARLPAIAGLTILRLS